MAGSLTVAGPHETLELTDDDRLPDCRWGVPPTGRPGPSTQALVQERIVGETCVSSVPEPSAPAGRGPFDVAVRGASRTISMGPGDVLVGKYQIEKILGQGGMGIVVSALHLQLRERVALKFLLVGGGCSDELQARFLREARVAARLANENIARVTDVGVLDNGASYMVMEFVTGIDLRALLDQEHQLDVSRAVEIVVQASRGLADAHVLGIVHRDLKPSNLLMSRRRDGTELVKILDFGISKAGLANAPELDDLTDAGTLLGSPKYMAPEQMTSADPVDERADVWSLGVILYEMITGEAPFFGPTPAATCMRVLGGEPPASIVDRRPDVPRELEAAVFRALRRKLEERTRDVATFAEEIVGALGASAPPSLIVSVQQTRSIVDSGKGESSAPGPSPGRSEKRSLVGPSGANLSRTLAPPAGSSRRRRGVLLGVMTSMLLVGGGLALSAARVGPSSSADMPVVSPGTPASPIASESAVVHAPLRPPASVAGVAPMSSASPEAAPPPSTRSPANPPPRRSDRKARTSEREPDTVPEFTGTADTPETAVDPLAERQ